MKLAFYNHRESGEPHENPLPCLGPLAVACKEMHIEVENLADPNRRLHDLSNWLIEYNLAVFHKWPSYNGKRGFTDCEEEFIKEENQSSRGLIVLEVSTERREPRVTPKDFVARDGAEARRYWVTVPDARGSGLTTDNQNAQANWRELLGALCTPGVFEAYLRNDRNVPGVEALKRFLGVQRTVVLPALSVLCQGYLAAGVDPEADHLKIEWPIECDSEKKIVEEALRKMGWKEFLREKENLQFLSGELRNPEKRPNLRKNVGEAKWWGSVFGDVEKAKQDAEEEWNSLNNSGKGQHWEKSNAQKLLDDIGSDNPIPPVGVAKAYLELADKLGGPA